MGKYKFSIYEQNHQVHHLEVLILIDGKIIVVLVYMSLSQYFGCRSQQNHANFECMFYVITAGIFHTGGILFETISSINLMSWQCSRSSSMIHH